MPRLTVSPRSLVVRPSTTVALTCAAVHSADTTTTPSRTVSLSDVRWTRDGRELDEGQGHVTLVIGEFEESTHGGVYRCSAVMAPMGGRAVSDHATLHAAGTYEHTYTTMYIKPQRLFASTS